MISKYQALSLLVVHKVAHEKNLCEISTLLSLHDYDIFRQLGKKIIINQNKHPVLNFELVLFPAIPNIQKLGREKTTTK